MFSAASDSVMLCAMVKAVTTAISCRIDAAEQQQADQEQQVVGADQDVMDAGRDEPAERPRRCPAACRRSTRTACVPRRESPARSSASAFVDVDERLVLRVVREHHGRDRDRAGRAARGSRGLRAAATGARRAARATTTIRRLARGRPPPAPAGRSASVRIASSWPRSTAGSSRRSIGSMPRSCATSKTCATTDDAIPRSLHADVDVAERRGVCRGRGTDADECDDEGCRKSRLMGS